MRKDRIVGLVAAGFLVAVMGCGDAEAPSHLVLSQLSGMKASEDGCEPDKTIVPPLEYDAGLGALGDDAYLLVLWIRNELPPNGDTDVSIGRTNTNRAQVDRIRVEVLDRESWGFLPEKMEVGTPFTVDTGGEVGSTTELIPVELARLLIEHPLSPILPFYSGFVSLPIRIQAVGKLGDGTEVRSNEFDFELRVCNGCLSNYGCKLGESMVGCSFAQLDTWTCE